MIQLFYNHNLMKTRENTNFNKLVHDEIFNITYIANYFTKN